MMREVPRRPACASETGDRSHVDVYLSKTLDYRALRYAGDEDDDVALVVETLVGELLAAAWSEADPSYGWSPSLS